MGQVPRDMPKVVLGLLAVFLLVWFVHELHGIWPLIAAAAVFVVLAILHESVLARIREIKSIVIHYERGVARLEDRWAGTAEGGDRFKDDTHPYSRDLDLFGKGSIFELLCTFRTRAGEATLARWLLEPATPDEIRARQNAAQELKTRIEFRERLFTAGDRVRLGLHQDSLAVWGEQAPSFGTRRLLVSTSALAVLWVASLVYGFPRAILTRQCCCCRLSTCS